jgi:lipoprotein-anchoring transpeptidase ErfK/SrfK
MEGLTMKAIGTMWTAVAAAALCSTVSGSELQGSAALKSVDISRCVGIAGPQERLECYDAAGAQALKSTTRPQSAGAADPQVTTAATVPSAAAASRDAPPAVVDSARPIKPADGRTQIDATVASLRTARDGSWIIVLSNGQVWQQTDLEKLDLKKGYSVRIYPSIWGPGFRLSAHEIRGFIQVTRVAAKP